MSLFNKGMEMDIEKRLHNLEEHIRIGAMTREAQWDKTNAYLDKFQKECDELKAQWNTFLKEIALAMAGKR